MATRRWIEATGAGLLGRSVASYLRLVDATTRWQVEGEDEFLAALSEGPVILVMWHSRLMLAPVHLARQGRRFVTLRDPSPAGRVSAAMQARFGHEPVAMSAKRDNRAGSRAVLQKMRAGQSLGLTADGPLGPAQVMKTAPLDWARVTGAPVFLYAFSTRRQRRLATWDRMLVPLPFTQGAYAYRRWDAALPHRRWSAAETEMARARLGAALTTLQAETDRRLGLPPGP